MSRSTSKRHARALREAEEAKRPRCAGCQCVIYPDADGSPGKVCKRCGIPVAVAHSTIV